MEYEEEMDAKPGSKGLKAALVLVRIVVRAHRKALKRRQFCPSIKRGEGNNKKKVFSLQETSINDEFQTKNLFTEALLGAFER